MEFNNILVMGMYPWTKRFQGTIIGGINHVYLGDLSSLQNSMHRIVARIVITSGTLLHSRFYRSVFVNCKVVKQIICQHTTID
jgi:hypothetical protein